MRYFLFKLAVNAAKRLCVWGDTYDCLNKALDEEEWFEKWAK